MIILYVMLPLKKNKEGLMFKGQGPNSAIEAPIFLNPVANILSCPSLSGSGPVSLAHTRTNKKLNSSRF